MQLALRWGRNWAAPWHLALPVGKRFRGCRTKRLYVYLTASKISLPPGTRGWHLGGRGAPKDYEAKARKAVREFSGVEYARTRGTGLLALC